MSTLKGRTTCYNHACDREAERRESRRLGGLHRRRGAPGLASEVPVKLDTVTAIRSYLEQAAEDLRTCEPGLARARTQVYLAATVMKVVELAEIDRRIAALEARSFPSTPLE